MTREELLAQAAKEIDPPSEKKPCWKCGGSGVISIGGGCMGYDDEPCPICLGNPNTPSLKEVLQDAKQKTNIVVTGCPDCGGYLWEGQYHDCPAASYNPGTCSICGGSLCPEEWHDCEADRDWRRTH